MSRKLRAPQTAPAVVPPAKDRTWVRLAVGSALIVAASSEKEFENSYHPATREADRAVASPDGRYRVVTPDNLMGRKCVEDTMTGKKRFLKHGSGLMASPWDARWSPRGDRFLMTGVEWRLPSGLWRWRREAAMDMMHVAAVYMVNVERPAAQAGKIEK